MCMSKNRRNKGSVYLQWSRFILVIKIFNEKYNYSFVSDNNIYSSTWGTTAIHWVAVGTTWIWSTRTTSWVTTWFTWGAGTTFRPTSGAVRITICYIF